jgi:hypothetical protein
MQPLRTLTVSHRECSNRPDGTPHFKKYVCGQHLEVNQDLLTNVKNVLDILFTHIYYPSGTPTVHSKRTKQRLVDMISPHIIYAKKEDDSLWSMVDTKVYNITLPPGDYYIGDLCYAVPDEIYQDIWGNKFMFTDGLYKRTATATSPEAYFAMRGTGGDGEMIAKGGKRFSIDAGHIGIASLSICTEQNKPDTVYHFEHPVVCELLGDSFTFSDGHTYVSLCWPENDEEDDE